jgi:site-specific DNA-cytosine methylase
MGKIRIIELFGGIGACSRALEKILKNLREE